MTNTEEGVRSQESGVRRKTSRFEGSRVPSRTFEDLIVWQKAHAWVLEVYRLTAKFPSCELYGLTSQLRRAAVSIPANIAEGYKKAGIADKRRFMNIAQGSLEECRYYLILVHDLHYSEPPRSRFNSLKSAASSPPTPTLSKPLRHEIHQPSFACRSPSPDS